VVAPRVTAAIDELERAGRISLKRRKYERRDLEHAFLVFAATDDRETNRRVANDAAAAGALLNCSDDPEACDFVVPSTVNRDGITVAISTSARSPGLVRALREELETWLTPEHAKLLDLVAEVRRDLQRIGRNPSGAVWRHAINREIVGLLARGERGEARRRLESALAAADPVEAR
jgi:precorrin-2 dehydrogenase / sirohydrochlorin ferrochelatase